MSDTAQLRGSHLPGGLAEAREGLLRWVDAGGERGRLFLEAHLLRVAPGQYRIRHAADASLPASALTVHADPFDAREIAQNTGAGEHRPLKTAPSLRRGWSFEALDRRSAWLALDYLYPACAAHWYAGSQGTLRVTHWRETAARQSGIYSAVGLLPEPAVRDVVRACCGDAVCLRQVAWGMDATSTEPLQADLESALGIGTGVASEVVVPCPEACSMFISLARKVLSVERSAPAESGSLGALRAAEVEQIRELVAAGAAGTLGSVREGEFDQPTNQRRVRYLAARLLR